MNTDPNQIIFLQETIADLKRQIDFIVRSDRYLFQRDIEMSDRSNIRFNGKTGTKFGTTTGQKIGFYNTTPIAQRSGSAQTAVATASSTQSTPWGYSTQAQADAIVTLVNELRAWAVSIGFIKGSA